MHISIHHDDGMHMDHYPQCAGAPLMLRGVSNGRELWEVTIFTGDHALNASLKDLFNGVLAAHKRFQK